MTGFSAKFSPAVATFSSKAFTRSRALPTAVSSLVMACSVRPSTVSTPVRTWTVVSVTALLAIQLLTIPATKRAIRSTLTTIITTAATRFKILMRRSLFLVRYRTTLGNCGASFTWFPTPTRTDYDQTAQRLKSPVAPVCPSRCRDDGARTEHRHPQVDRPKGLKISIQVIEHCVPRVWAIACFTPHCFGPGLATLQRRPGHP
jgi:hypothetical protein